MNGIIDINMKKNKSVNTHPTGINKMEIIDK